MENPLELPVSYDPMVRISELARDLAYGAMLGSWEPNISEGFAGKIVLFGIENANVNSFNDKWKREIPSLKLLQTFGYFDGEKLTEKAFDLLKQPVALLQVFISYKHEYSSTFGVLIERSLQANGVHAYIDRNLEPTEAWFEQVKREIDASKYFVCVLAKGTLESDAVKQEIHWAQTQRKKIIPIWHLGFNASLIPNDLQMLRDNPAIKVVDESAESYHDAIEKLNRLLNQWEHST